MRWQVQDAKQRLSEVLRKVQVDGPQFITRHGEEVAVVIDIASYRRLAGIEVEVDFKEALAGGFHTGDEFADAVDEVVADRKDSLPREVDLGAAR
ncbi:MAG: type II toxin-antitoxin system prevent-host-death family antitoxin [Pseudonocardiaceae bacterium]|nr:type II toxin-antitoxin system prevent-host-death family antitoxin [Pseudonocardiaceae bacterium]